MTALELPASTGGGREGADEPQLRRLPRGDAPGSRDRDYWVFAPRRPLRRRILGRPAVLLVLHGCKQDALDMIRTSRFVEYANARDYVAVFPSVTSWSALPCRVDNCWGFWIPQERSRGEGEVGDLRRILEAVEAAFGTDPERRYVAGLSSGGAMAVAMAVAHGDAIRAAGAVAGLAYGESSAAVSTEHPFASLVPWFLEDSNLRSTAKLSDLPTLLREMEAAQMDAGTRNPVPLTVIQSTRDQVVGIENARMLRDVWLAGRGGTSTHRVQRKPIDGATGVDCSYLDAAGEPVVQTVFYKGRAAEPTHYWPGDGDDGGFASSAGPSATRTLLDFFARHGL